SETQELQHQAQQIRLRRGGRHLRARPHGDDQACHRAAEPSQHLASAISSRIGEVNAEGISRFAFAILAERPTSFAQQEILALLGAYERRVYLCRKKRFLAVWYTKCPQI